MFDKGFAIRCPHCRKWNVWKDVDPREVALDSTREFEQILKGLVLARAHGEGGRFSQRKLWQCKNPRWACPASFEAFICRSEEDAFRFLKIANAWSFKRDFRLYKANCESRWDDKEEGYYGILFNREPIPRQREIELELLMDRELLSRAIVGMSCEIQAPLTFFAANVFNPPNKRPQTYWMPIEGYSAVERMVPEPFNAFCTCCRSIVIERLIKKFRNNKFSVNNCPIGFGRNGKCAGKKPACMERAEDWAHCPAFMKERKACPCTNSDLRIIRKIEENWRGGQSMENGVRDRCWAGFTEIGFPVIVHDHVLGIAMTGQFFFEEEEIKKVGDLVGRWSILKGREDELEKARQALIDEERRLRQREESKFWVAESRVQRIIGLLRDNIKRVEDMAKSRYRDFRGRSESAFREEISGFIQRYKIERDFFEKRLKHVLERMQDFWAFEAVYLAGYSLKTKDISVIGFSHKYREGKSFGIPGKKEGVADVRDYQMHPCPYLHRRGEEVPRYNRLLQELLPIFERASHDPELEVPEGKYYFFVLIPFLEEVYTFVFAVRDEMAVASLKQRVEGGVSKLCQDEILETCTEVIYEFGDVRSFVELKEQALKVADVVKMSSIAAHLAHTLGNRLGTIPKVVRDIKERIGALKVKDKYLLKRLGHLESDSQDLLKLKTQFEVSNYAEKLEALDVLSLVSRGVRTAHLESTGTNVTVVEESLRDLPQILGVETLLVDTFVDILQNAVEANAKNIAISGAKNRNTVDVVISDDGKGMSELEMERIWSPLYVSSKSGGLHISLSVGRYVIVNLMGGDVSVESEVGKGSTFKITLRVHSSDT